MKIIILTLFFITRSAFADVWVWYLNTDPEGLHYEVAANESEALASARTHDWFDTSEPELWAHCNKGFFALMTFFPPGDPIRVEKRFGGGCEQATLEKAYAAAIKSCKSRPECNAALRDKYWAFNLSSFQNDGNEEVKSWKECTYYVKSNNNCTITIDGRVQYSSFDLDDFLKNYEDN